MSTGLLKITACDTDKFCRPTLPDTAIFPCVVNPPLNIAGPLNTELLSTSKLPIVAVFNKLFPYTFKSFWTVMLPPVTLIDPDISKLPRYPCLNIILSALNTPVLIFVALSRCFCPPYCRKDILIYN